METKNLLKSLKRRLSWMLCLVALLAVGQSAFCAATMNKRYYYIKTTAKWEENSPCSKIEFNNWDNCGYGSTSFNATTATKCGDNLYYIDVPNKAQDAYAVKALRYASDCSTYWSATNCINNNNNQNNTCIDISGDTFQSSSLNLAPKHMYITGGATTSTQWNEYDFEPMIKQTDGSYKQKLGTLTTSNKEFKINAYNYWDNNNTTWWSNATIKTASCEGVTLVKDGNAKIKLNTGYKNPVYVYVKDNSEGKHEIWAVATSDCTAPSITTQPSTTDKSYCQGAAATALSVTANGTVDSYQWMQCETEDGDYTNVTTGTGGTTNSYTPSTATVGTLYYKCKVTGCNTTKTSNASGAITVNPKISFSSEDAINFGEVAVNSESSPVTVDITTCGFSGFDCQLFGGDVTQFNLSFVNPGQTGNGSFTVKFTPKNTGAFTTNVRIAGAGYEKKITVTGTGIKSCTPPTKQSVSLSGCSVVAMAGSQSGYTYTLYKDDVKVDGSDWAGDGNAHSWSVTTTGTYTVKAKDTETGGCLTTMSGSANVTKLGPVVTVTPSEGGSDIHPYEKVTFSADKSVSWSLSPASETAYISTESGSSTIFKGAVGTYTITASADGCDTDTQFNVVVDPDNC